MKKTLVRALVASFMSAFCSAAPITIEDFSFETNSGGNLNSGGWNNDLSPEWQERDGTNSGSSFEEYINGFSAEGTDHVGMATGVFIWQDTGVALAPNTTYTLTIAAGNRSGQSQAGNVSTYALLAGASNLGSFGNTGAVVANTSLTLASASVDATVLNGGAQGFADAEPLVYSTGATVPAANLVILLGDASAGGRSHFDNIRLDATASEPDGSAAIENASASSVTQSTALLRGSVTDIGEAAPSITIFFGPEDGGTNPQAWQSSVSLPGTQSASFSASISALTNATTYYYTARAINSGGTSWATPSLSFETLANAATLTQGSASNITADSATLPVTVTNTGGDTPTITLYYGKSDGGKTAGSWEFSQSLGTVAATSSADLTGLSPATNYFYRFSAQNEGGLAWSEASGSFTTSVVTAPSIENRSVGSLTAYSAALRGDVTSTGSQSPEVTLFYGKSDGGTTAANWENTVTVGIEDGNFSRFISDLSPNTTYYYTALATNSIGSSWAAPSESFTTPDALAAQVVINEIHYDPSDETSAQEFIEIYNPGTSAIDLSGWMITDAVEFTFPNGTVIAPNGYLVVGEDPATLSAVYGITALGPWTGGLSNTGEEIDLRDPSGTLQDQVNYDDGFPWPTGARGGGGSIELLNAALDNDLGGSWRTSGTTIDVGPGPTTVYIAADDSNWRYRKGTSEASTPVAEWRTTTFVEDDSWTTAQTPIGYGDGDDNTVLNDMRSSYSSVYLRREFTVDPLAIPQNLKLRIYADDGAIVWINGQEVQRTNVSGGQKAYNDTGQNHEAAWEEFVISGANTYLVGGTNVIAVHALNATLGSSDFSIDVTLEATNESSGGGTSPTPGSPNTSASLQTPPAIRQVEHAPTSPTSADPVTITAKLTDPDGMGAVTLDYQLVNPGSYIRIDDAAYDSSWTTVTMVDDGTNGDQFSGDSIYTVVLPASLQTHRRLVRYRIHFQDTNGTKDTAPYSDDEQPNFAYFVYDGAPSWTGSFTPTSSDETFPASLMNSLPTYHLIANNGDVINSQYSGGSDGRHMSGTIVYNGRVYDHIEFENRGEASTYVSGKNKWRIHFNRARRFRPLDNWGRPYESTWTRINIQSISSPWAALNRGMAGLDESVSMRMYELAGIPSPRTHYFSFRVIDDAQEANASNQYEGDVWGLYLAMESPNGSFLDDRGLADGNIYKIEGGGGDKKEQGDSQVTSSSDWSSFYSSSNSAQTEQWWRDNMYMPGYYSMRALNRFLGNVDIRIGYNHYFYHEPTQDQWHVMPWDLDMMWIAETHQAGVIRQQNSINNHSQLRLEFRNRARELLDLVGADGTPTGGQIGQLVDEYTDMINPEGQELTWADVDAFMWNYHPRTNGAAGNASGQTNHKGNFYASPFRDSRMGGGYNRYLESQDHEGLVKHILSYTTDNFTGASWSPGNGVVEGYGYEYLKYEARDTNIPNKPTISYQGTPSFPVNQLFFNSSSFSDPNGNGTFGKMRWRIAKILAPGLPGYVENTPRTYEIETVATSPDFDTFNAEYLFPAEIAEPGVTYRVRVQHEDSTGRTSNWSEAIEFVPTAPSVELWQDNLVISEIMYNPPQPTGGELAVSESNGDYEFIEITNISESLTLDLADLDFTNGITFDFATASVTTLAPGASVLLVKNIAAFEARYGKGLPVIGSYPNSLSDGGERLVLSYALNTPIIDFVYDDAAPWPTSPDGLGYALVLADPASSPDHSLATSWVAGNVIGGSPGSPEPELSAFDSYLAGAFSAAELNDASISGPLADPDHDGYSNILEYALLGQPTTSDSLVMHGTVEIEGESYPSITFLQRIPAPELTYLGQQSESLDSWNEGPEHLVEHAAQDQGDGTYLITLRSLTSLSESSNQFLRVKVSLSTP